jgi:hypothetical protein
MNHAKAAPGIPLLKRAVNIILISPNFGDPNFINPSRILYKRNVLLNISLGPSPGL